MLQAAGLLRISGRLWVKSHGVVQWENGQRKEAQCVEKEGDE